VQLAKDYAQKNYNKGFDTFVECYTDDEWREFVNDHGRGLMTWPTVKRVMIRIASVWQDRQAEADYQRRAAIGEPEKCPSCGGEKPKDQSCVYFDNGCE
jgi:hypothetical protein